MPKIKTHKALADRIKVTATWKCIHKKCWRNHLLTNKWRSNKPHTYGRALSDVHAKKIQALIPYML